MKKKEKIWTRKCLNPNNNPNCKKEIVYKNKSYYNDSIRKNRICISCRSYKENNPFYGKKLTKEHIEKRRRTIIERGSYKGKNHPMYGKHPSKETIEKRRKTIIESGVLKGKPAWNKGKTYEEMYGEQRAIKLKEQYRKTRINYNKIHTFPGDKNPSKRPDVKKKLRIKYLERINDACGDIGPFYSKNACKTIDEYGKKNGYNFLHAMNGGEFNVIGYWVDGYDKNKNIVIEYYERHHYDENGRLKDREVKREQEIIQELNCKFIRINAFNKNNIEIEYV